MINTSVAYVGDDLHDASGQKIGKITDMISDHRTLEPQWYVVKLGMLKGSHPVPVASVHRADGAAVVSYDKELVASAPKLQDGPPTEAEEEALNAHYSLSH